MVEIVQQCHMRAFQTPHRCLAAWSEGDRGSCRQKCKRYRVTVQRRQTCSPCAHSSTVNEESSRTDRVRNQHRASRRREALLSIVALPVLLGRSRYAYILQGIDCSYSAWYILHFPCALTCRLHLNCRHDHERTITLH